MAYPLAVSEQALVEPVPFPVGAEAAIIYDTGGRTDADEIYIDKYLTGGLEAFVIGFIVTRGRYLPDHPETSAGPGGDFFRGSAQQTTRDFFESDVRQAVIEVAFFWDDVSSFFWWDSPYPETDGEVTEGEPLKDFFSPADPNNGRDFFA